MLGRRTPASLALLILATALIGYGQDSPGQTPAPPKVINLTPRMANEDAGRYSQLFALVSRMMKEADQAERDGMNSNYLRNYFITQAGLNSAEAMVLNQVASQLQDQIAQYDAQLQKQQTAYHVDRQTKLWNRQPFDPEPENLKPAAKISAHEAFILKARDQLHTLLGDEAFLRLDSYTRQLVKSGPSQAPTGAPPPPALASSTTDQALARERAAYRLFFFAVTDFNKTAAQDDALGLAKTAESRRTLVQRTVGLTDEQARILGSVVADYNQRYAEASARAVEAKKPATKIALDMLARDGKVNRDDPAYTAALGNARAAAMQANTVIDQSLQQLRTALGPEAFARLDDYVKGKGSVASSPAPGSAGVRP